MLSLTTRILRYTAAIINQRLSHSRFSRSFKVLGNDSIQLVSQFFVHGLLQKRLRSLLPPERGHRKPSCTVHIAKDETFVVDVKTTQIAALLYMQVEMRGSVILLGRMTKYLSRWGSHYIAIATILEYKMQSRYAARARGNKLYYYHDMMLTSYIYIIQTGVCDQQREKEERLNRIGLSDRGVGGEGRIASDGSKTLSSILFQSSRSSSNTRVAAEPGTVGANLSYGAHLRNEPHWRNRHAAPRSHQHHVVQTRAYPLCMKVFQA